MKILFQIVVTEGPRLLIIVILVYLEALMFDVDVAWAWCQSILIA